MAKKGKKTKKNMFMKVGDNIAMTLGWVSTLAHGLLVFNFNLPQKLAEWLKFPPLEGVIYWAMLLTAGWFAIRWIKKKME